MKSARNGAVLSILVVSTAAGLLTPWPSGRARAQSPEPAGRSADDAPLASISFARAEEQYRDVPYLWLGRVTIYLTIDVPPRPGHALELLWGSKKDSRAGTVTINGKQVEIARGGYDGFRWVRVPVPAGITGDRYEVVIRRGNDKPGFIGSARLVAANARPACPDDLKTPAHKITLKTTSPSLPEAFPEMRAIWDREPPAPKGPVADARVEGLFRRAERNGRVAAELFFRCHKFVEGWLAQSDPKTGLIPRNLTRDRDIWNAQDAAADNYPFMVLTAAFTDRPMFDGRMLDMLRTELKLTSRIDRLPDTYSFSKQGFQTEKPNLDTIIFGGSEYVKDGLLPLTEWLGPSPWSERMLGIIDDIWKHAPVETPFGMIPSTNVEVNGEMLQALSRVYWMTGDEKYLDWAMRLGDYYLLGNSHPTRDFASLRLRDHGCEIVSGLSELYVAVSFAKPEKKKVYKGPIHEMFDRILEVGRNEHGMLYNSINPKTGEHGRGICDTWGYNYNGMYAVYMVDKKEAYRQAIRHVLANLKEHLTDHDWGSADEYADSIEGAINLYNREPVASAAEWIDSEIRDEWAKQRPDGVIEGWHGDGNSARTAIMVATWKTQGLTLRPWRADVRVGAVRDGDTIHVSLAADMPWNGKLLFDKPRHEENLHLPIDYPRINQFPEWFTVPPGGRYVVRDVTAGKETKLAGKTLREGMPMELTPGVEVRLAVTEKR